MSYIGHHCLTCGHAEICRNTNHETAYRCEGNGGRCNCYCRRSLGQPKVLPTFGLDGQRSQTVIAPGGTLTAGLKTCGCAACKALFRTVTAA